MFCWLVFTFLRLVLGFGKNPNTLGAVHLIMHSLIHWFIQPFHRSGMDQAMATLRSQRQASVTGHGPLPLDRNRFLQFYLPSEWQNCFDRSTAQGPFSLCLCSMTIRHGTTGQLCCNITHIVQAPAVYTTVPSSKGSITESSMWPNSLAKHVLSLFSNVPAAPSWSPPIQ